MLEKQADKRLVVVSCFIFIATLLLALLRCFYGVETTDEAIYVSDAYLTIRGSVPIITSWTQFTTYSFITSLLLRPFAWFAGSTEGVVLYMRLLFLLCRIIVVVMFVYLLSSKISKSTLLLSATFYLLFVGENLQNFSYNTISIDITFLASAFIAAALFEEKYCRKSILFAGLAGLCASVAVIAHPSQLITWTAFVLIFALCEYRKQKALKFSCSFVIAGCLLGLMTVLYLIIKGGGIAALFRGIDHVLHLNPYFSIARAPKTMMLKEDFGNFMHVVCGFFGKYLLILLIGSVINVFYRKERIKDSLTVLVWLALCCVFFAAYPRLTVLIRWIAFAILAAAVCFVYRERSKTKILNGQLLAYCFCIAYIWYMCSFVTPIWHGLSSQFTDWDDTIFQIALTCPPALLAPILSVYISDSWSKKVLLALWLPAVVYLLASGVTAFDGINARHPALVGAVACCLIYIFTILNGKTIGRITLVVFAVLLCLLCGIKLYGYVYRDEAIGSLTTTVSEGAYKGLKTTEARANGITKLEQNIRKYTDKNDDVLFLDHVPMSYIMTEARHCTPCSGDFAMYTYSVNDPSCYFTYFRETGRTPSKIIYIQTNRDPHVSLEEPGYKFTDYVKANYHLTHQIKGEYFPMWVFERNK